MNEGTPTGSHEGCARPWQAAEMGWASWGKGPGGGGMPPGGDAESRRAGTGIRLLQFEPQLHHSAGDLSFPGWKMGMRKVSTPRCPVAGTHYVPLLLLLCLKTEQSPWQG